MGGGPHPRSPTSQQLACFLRPRRLPPAPSPALLMRGHQALSVNCPLGLEVVGGIGSRPQASEAWWAGEGMARWWAEADWPASGSWAMARKLPKDVGPPSGLGVLAPNHPR